MDKEKAQRLIKERFWRFKNILVDQYPKYREMFDSIVSEADQKGLLWEVLEFATIDIEIKISQRESDLELPGSDYLDSLIFGYSEWIK